MMKGKRGYVEEGRYRAAMRKTMRRRKSRKRRQKGERMT